MGGEPMERVPKGGTWSMAREKTEFIKIFINKN